MARNRYHSDVQVQPVKVTRVPHQDGSVAYDNRDVRIWDKGVGQFGNDKFGHQSDARPGQRKGH